MSYGPSEGLHVCMMGKRTAEEHQRRCYNIPANCGIGWKPYTIIVTSNGGTLAHCAFTSLREFRLWLNRRGGYAVKLFTWWGRGIRCGRIVRKAGA